MERESGVTRMTSMKLLYPKRKIGIFFSSWRTYIIAALQGNIIRKLLHHLIKIHLFKINESSHVSIKRFKNVHSSCFHNSPRAGNSPNIHQQDTE